MTSYVFDLAAMTAEARALWLDVYGLGYADGIEAGRRQLEAEWTDLHAAAAAAARRAANREPFDVLAERRGDRARAERQRAILAGRGIAS